MSIIHLLWLLNGCRQHEISPLPLRFYITLPASVYGVASHEYPHLDKRISSHFYPSDSHTHNKIYFRTALNDDTDADDDNYNIKVER